MRNINDAFPKHFIVEYRAPSLSSTVDFSMYKAGNKLSWEGYYKSGRLSLYYNDFDWCIVVYIFGRIIMQLRHRESEPTSEEIQSLVQIGCYAIDIFTEEK